MGRMTKKCANCDRNFFAKPGRKFCSYRCSFRVVAENAKQLHEKKGPLYEKWKAGFSSYAKILDGEK